MSLNEHRMFRLHTKHHCSFHLYDKRPFFFFGGRRDDMPTPMAVRSKKLRQMGPQSAHLWWPAMDKL